MIERDKQETIIRRIGTWKEEGKEGGRNVGEIMVENESRPPLLWWQVGSSSKDQIGKRRRQEEKE